MSNKYRSFYLWSESPYSKFCGLFFDINNEMVKCLEKIEVVGSVLEKTNDKIIGISNERRLVVEDAKGISKDGVSKVDLLETYYLDYNSNSFACFLSKKSKIKLSFDVHKFNDFSEWGRNYSIYSKGDCIVLKYVKENVGNGGDKKVQYTYFVAIKPNMKKFNFEKLPGELKYRTIGNFVKQEYYYDKFRHSDAVRYVYDGIELDTSFFTLGMAITEEEALKLADDLYSNYSKVKTSDPRLKVKSPKTGAMGFESFAYKNANISLAKLTSDLGTDSVEGTNGVCGISAGYPWFYQFWTRDELISLGYYIRNGQLDLVKRIIMKYVNCPGIIEKFPAIFPNEGNLCADGKGWLVLRIGELIEQSQKLELSGVGVSESGILTFDEIKKLQFFVEKIAQNIISNLKYGLVYSGKNETWMDTNFNDNGREGYCIEIQALSCRALKVAYNLTNKVEYLEAEKKLRARTVAKFYAYHNLYDFLYDDVSGSANLKAFSVVRPNVFIAYYVYPELLPATGWEEVFDKTIPGLWLLWGGLSSLDVKNPLFVNEYTGENNASYHRGDSWYFLNCMAATCMLSLNKEKYVAYSKKIFDACVKESLNNGVIGSISEVSSAKELSGYGCLSQAWSLAMFIELFEKMY